MPAPDIVVLDQTDIHQPAVTREPAPVLLRGLALAGGAVLFAMSVLVVANVVGTTTGTIFLS